MPGSSSGSQGGFLPSTGRGWLTLSLHSLVVVFVLGVSSVFSNSSFISGNVRESSGLVTERVLYRGVEGGVGNCDQLLKNQLVFQRGASTPERMNEIVRLIQAQRHNCVSELWDPSANLFETLPGECFSSDDLRLPSEVWRAAGGSGLKVGDLSVPRSLSDISERVRVNSGRDSDNNILVYWSVSDGRVPADGSACWLFVSRLNVWDETY